MVIFTLVNTLIPESREGKTIKKLEEVHNLQCMITEPTRITPKSKPFLDVILTTKPDLFNKCGRTFNPEISDHTLIYGILEESANQYTPRIILYRSMKKLDYKKFNEFNKFSHIAPRNVGETYDTLDDQYDYWETLLRTGLDEHMPKKRMSHYEEQFRKPY